MPLLLQQHVPARRLQPELLLALLDGYPLHLYVAVLLRDDRLEAEEQLGQRLDALDKLCLQGDGQSGASLCARRLHRLRGILGAPRGLAIAQLWVWDAHGASPVSWPGVVIFLLKAAILAGAARAVVAPEGLGPAGQARRAASVLRLADRAAQPPADQALDALDLSHGGPQDLLPLQGLGGVPATTEGPAVGSGVFQAGQLGHL